MSRVSYDDRYAGNTHIDLNIMNNNTINNDTIINSVNSNIASKNSRKFKSVPSMSNVPNIHNVENSTGFSSARDSWRSKTAPDSVSSCSKKTIRVSPKNPKQLNERNFHPNDVSQGTRYYKNINHVSKDNSKNNRNISDGGDSSDSISPRDTNISPNSSPKSARRFNNTQNSFSNERNNHINYTNNKVSSTNVQMPKSPKTCKSTEFQTHIDEVNKLVANIKGRIINIYAYDSKVIERPQVLISLPPSKVVTDHYMFEIQCECKYVWVVKARDINHGCPCCKLLKSGVYELDPNDTQDKFLSKVSLRCIAEHHRVVEDVKKFKPGYNFAALPCKSCILLEHARKCLDDDGLRLDTYCVNRNDNSKLRFQCNKRVHHHLCGNAACVEARKATQKCSVHSLTCTDRIVCNNEFYATPAQLHSRKSHVYNCNSGHKPAIQFAGIPNALIVLETIFNVRFDDTLLCGVELTGYNRDLKIALHCRADPNTMDNEEKIVSVCKSNSIDLIILDERFGKASDVRRCIIAQLYDLHRLPFESIEIAEDTIANIIHYTNDNYAYPHRGKFKEKI